MATDTSENQFQEEVLKLFAEEGLEWLGQCKTALEELESGPPSDQAAKLYDTILRCLTNLMGSAATVDLAALQKLALALIPLLQAMQSNKVASKPEHFDTIRQGLTLLTSATQVLEKADSKTVVIVNLESIMRLQAEHIQKSVAKVQGVAKAPASPSKATVEQDRKSLAAIVNAIFDLKHSRSSSLEPTRNLVEIVLRKLHRLLDQDAASLTAGSVSSILFQLEGLDARFLEETQRRHGTVKKALAALKHGKRESEEQKRTLQDALHELALLHEMAREVGAVAMAKLLHGLETLLLLVVYKGVTLDPKRVEVIGSRVDALSAMAQQWVEMGRAEKAAIEKALAPLHDEKPAHK
jgi:chemotaxis protein histidine kinase CheA